MLCKLDQHWTSVWLLPQTSPVFILSKQVSKASPQRPTGICWWDRCSNLYVHLPRCGGGEIRTSRLAVKRLIVGSAGVCKHRNIDILHQKMLNFKSKTLCLFALHSMAYYQRCYYTMPCVGFDEMNTRWHFNTKTSNNVYSFFHQPLQMYVLQTRKNKREIKENITFPRFFVLIQNVHTY